MPVLEHFGGHFEKRPLYGISRIFENMLDDIAYNIIWNGFLTTELVKNDTSIVLFEYNLLKIADFSKFWPLLGLVHTFARGIGAHFVLNTSKYQNPLSNLHLLSVVTGGHMTLL